MARTMRNFRLDDDVYKAAQERARREYTNVTAVIEQYLAAYGGLRRSDDEKLLGERCPRCRKVHEELSCDDGREWGPYEPAEPPVKRSQPVMGYSKEQQARGKR